MITLEDVTKVFQTGDRLTTVLQDISLSVPAGQFVSIVGASGNGKSTLLNMITGIDRPSSGRVTINGADLQAMSENELAQWRGRNVGIIFQFFQLLPALTLHQNIVLAMDFAGKVPRRRRAERAMALLDQVGLADQAYKLPGTVSGGQQQRAAIARALANDPPLVVADEPTGNLDSRTAETVQTLLEIMHRNGKTVVMVTHDRDLAQRTERIVHIANGQLTGVTKQNGYRQEGDRALHAYIVA
jgi:putative ABC transport system ATP-binding protein